MIFVASFHRNELTNFRFDAFHEFTIKTEAITGESEKRERNQSTEIKLVSEKQNQLHRRWSETDMRRTFRRQSGIIALMFNLQMTKEKIGQRRVFCDAVNCKAVHSVLNNAFILSNITICPTCTLYGAHALAGCESERVDIFSMPFTSVASSVQCTRACPSCSACPKLVVIHMADTPNSRAAYIYVVHTIACLNFKKYGICT